jgi:hypothetical protein
MEGHELFDRLERVKAPDDFEERCFARLTQATRERAHRRTVFRYSFAGSAAVFVAGFLILNTVVLHKSPGLSYASRGKSESVRPVTALRPAGFETAGAGLVPVMEKADYSSEFRNASFEPQTVYILEQVSEGAPSGVKF